MLDLTRLLWTSVRTLRAPRLALHETSRVPLRIVPADLDVFGHVTNARYLSLMNFGRADLLVRSGLARAAWNLRAPIVVGRAEVDYLAPLHLGRAVLLETRLVDWDDKWLRFEHRLLAGERLAARGLVRALFRRGRTNVAPAALLAAAGHATAPPDVG